MHTDSSDRIDSYRVADDRAEVWRRVASHVGEPAPEALKEALEAGGLVEGAMAYPESATEYEDDLVRATRAYLAARPQARPLRNTRVAASGRWAMWEKLRALLFGDMAVPHRGPVEFYALGADEAASYDSSGLPLASSQVEIRFERRIAREVLINTIRKEWPRLVKEGFVEPTREIGARALSLAEHVCIDEAESSWQVRFDRWNDSHPGWAYSDRRSFITAFHRVEEQISGERNGLRWLYDEDAWRWQTAVEVLQFAAAGSRRAREVIDRYVKREGRFLTLGELLQLEPELTRRARSRADAELDNSSEL